LAKARTAKPHRKKTPLSGGGAAGAEVPRREKQANIEFSIGYLQFDAPILSGGLRIDTMPERRFPPPWSVEELEACFIVLDASGQRLGYFYFEAPGAVPAKELH